MVFKKENLNNINWSRRLREFLPEIIQRKKKGKKGFIIEKLYKKYRDNCNKGIPKYSDCVNL